MLRKAEASRQSWTSYNDAISKGEEVTEDASDHDLRIWAMIEGEY